MITNCPKCESSRLQYQKQYGYWECSDCGQVWGFDEDDPDYDESEMYPLYLGLSKNSHQKPLADNGAERG